MSVEEAKSNVEAARRALVDASNELAEAIAAPDAPVSNNDRTIQSVTVTYTDGSQETVDGGNVPPKAVTLTEPGSPSASVSGSIASPASHEVRGTTPELT